MSLGVVTVVHKKSETFKCKKYTISNVMFDFIELIKLIYRLSLKTSTDGGR